MSRTRVATSDEIRAFERNLLDWKAKGMVPAETVISALDYIRGLATRAVVSLNTGLNVRDSIEELDQLIEILDCYPDVLPHNR